MTKKKISPVGAYVYERGGLTNNPSDDAEPVDHFDFCPNCEREVPVDAQDVCMYCFKLLDSNNTTQGHE